mmetsp:Transcript_19988/g.47719  ORF Transcript_19988/g.47719 Transcript_19988/m.47719 type:complete len:354 (+) Transcript_19988:1069-2130(+)
MELLDETVDVNLEDHQELLTLDGSLDGPGSQHSHGSYHSWNCGKMAFSTTTPSTMMTTTMTMMKKMATSSPFSIPQQAQAQQKPSFQESPREPVSSSPTTPTVVIAPSTPPATPSSSSSSSSSFVPQEPTVTPPSTPSSPLSAEMSLWGEWDVPLGRAQEVREFVGNVRFRSLVEQYRPAYHQTTRKPDKTAISMTIFKHITAHGGRFLDKRKAGKRNLGNGNGGTTVFEWYQIPQDKALAKISQALRLGTRPVRKYTAAPPVPEMAGYHYRQNSSGSYGYTAGGDYHQQQHQYAAYHAQYHHHYHHHQQQQQPQYQEQPSHYASAAPVKLPTNIPPTAQPSNDVQVEQSAKR